MSEKIQEYRGEKVVVRFDTGKCVHSRNCVLGWPQVYQANVPGAWIKPDNATVDAVVMSALSCPSGAITYERLDGGAQEAAPAVNVARVRENGPLALHADMHMGGSTTLRATLCRCGASKNKPYCDGSHTAAGFQATGEPATQASEPLKNRAGPLEIKPKPDGPLEITGNLEIVSGTGRTLNRLEKTWLCRCGQSQNKPYCDGTHKRTGFKTG